MFAYPMMKLKAQLSNTTYNPFSQWDADAYFSGYIWEYVMPDICITSAPLNHSNYMMLTMAALTNSFYSCTVVPNPTASWTPILPLIPLCINNTAANLSVGCQSPIPPIPQSTIGLFDYEYTPLIHQVIHNGGNIFIPNSFYENLLHSAPCGGPHNYGHGDFCTEEWSSQDRLEMPEERWINGIYHIGAAPDTTFSGVYGEYSGLDYMFYYNLYQMAIRNTSNPYKANYFNKMHRTYNQSQVPFTVNGVTMGDSNSPLDMRGFETVTIGNTNGTAVDFQTTANALFQAGDKIDVLPGTTIQGNVTLETHVFTCATCGGGTYNRAASDSTIAGGAYGMPDNDSLMYLAQGGHYTNLPLNNPQQDEAENTLQLSPEQLNLLSTISNSALKGSAVANAPSVLVSPNPFSDNTMIELFLPNDEQEGLLGLYNSMGQQVSVISNGAFVKGLHNFSLVKGNLVAGVYLLSYQSASTQINKRVVVY